VRAAICPKNVCIPVRFISLDTEGVGVLKGVGKLSVFRGSKSLKYVFGEWEKFVTKCLGIGGKRHAAVWWHTAEGARGHRKKRVQ